MLKFYLIAIAAGAVSGVLHLTLSLGSLGGLILGYLAILPLFLAGLSLGAQAALIAGLAGGVIALFVGGLSFAGLYLGFYALPVAFLCRQALQSRTAANGDVAWYPPGRLVLCLLGLATGILLLVYVFLGLFADGLLPAIKVMLNAYIELAAQAPEVEVPANFAANMAPLVPVSAAASWILLILLNGVLAQGLLVTFKRNLRPSPTLADITYPLWLLPAFGAAVLSSFFDGNLAMLGKTLAVIGAVAYFLLGLGIIHGFFQRLSAGVPLKILFYVFGLAFIWPMVVAVGLLRHIKQLRRRADDGDDGRRKEQ